MILENIVDRGSFFPSLLDLKSRIQALNSQMILFIDHNAQALILADEGGPFPGFPRQVRTDQMLLHQNFLVELIQIRQQHRMQLAVAQQTLVA
ncbi:hypothetical protein D1872_251310 [compost metagenome]